MASFITGITGLILSILLIFSIHINASRTCDPDIIYALFNNLNIEKLNVFNQSIINTIPSTLNSNIYSGFLGSAISNTGDIFVILNSTTNDNDINKTTSLATLNIITGTVTIIGELGKDTDRLAFTDITFDSNDQLYGIIDTSYNITHVQTSIFKIDSNTADVEFMISITDPNGSVPVVETLTYNWDDGKLYRLFGYSAYDISQIIHFESIDITNNNVIQVINISVDPFIFLNIHSIFSLEYIGDDTFMGSTSNGIFLMDINGVIMDYLDTVTGPVRGIILMYIYNTDDICVPYCWESGCSSCLNQLSCSGSTECVWFGMTCLPKSTTALSPFSCDGDTIYAVGNDEYIRKVNLTDGTIIETTLTLPDETDYISILGSAVSQMGEIFVVLHPVTDIHDSISNARPLATLDIIYGNITEIGPLGEDKDRFGFSDITFDCDGQLYGITGNKLYPQDNYTMSSIFKINPITADVEFIVNRYTEFTTYTESLAYNWDDDRLYRMSGYPDFSDLIFESIDLDDNYTVESIPMSDPLGVWNNIEAVMSLEYIGNNIFYATSSLAREAIWSVNTDGVILNYIRTGSPDGLRGIIPMYNTNEICIPPCFTYDPTSDPTDNPITFEPTSDPTDYSYSSLSPIVSITVSETETTEEVVLGSTRNTFSETENADNIESGLLDSVMMMVIIGSIVILIVLLIIIMIICFCRNKKKQHDVTNSKMSTEMVTN